MNVEMNRGSLSRRGFLRRSLAAMTVGTGVPLWWAREVLAREEERADEKKVAANDKITVGAIGIGSPQSRGSHIVTREAMTLPGVQCVAVCDVDKSHLDKAATQVGNSPAKFKDFRELNDRKDINAVIIATPDHWHTLVAIDALRKGKDVYCEKPLTLTVAEGIALTKVAKETNRIFQVGSQQRSEFGGKFRLACELVRNNRIGKLSKIECLIGANPKGGPFKPQPVPDGLDFNFWLGQAPEVEYCKELCHYQFRWNYAYSGGKMTDWGAHHLDIAQWALDMDAGGPVKVEAKGEEPSKEKYSYNCHPTFEVTYTYANGVKVIASSQENGVRFHGENGQWIFVNRGKLEASDKKLIDEPLPKDAKRLYAVAKSHMANFFDCVRDRKPTICPADVGHRSVSVCHLGVIALRTGKQLKWDPAKQQFDDAEANKWLSRDMRKPWKLEA